MRNHIVRLAFFFSLIALTTEAHSQEVKDYPGSACKPEFAFVFNQAATYSFTEKGALIWRSNTNGSVVCPIIRDSENDFDISSVNVYVRDGTPSDNIFCTLRAGDEFQNLSVTSTDSTSVPNTNKEVLTLNLGNQSSLGNPMIYLLYCELPKVGSNQQFSVLYGYSVSE